MSGRNSIRIATYNVHKCRGMDRRVRPERIAEVIRALDADVVALQEVVRIEDAASDDQARFIAERLGYHFRFGENRRHGTGAYGNATLSRLPIVASENYDLTWQGRERRGALRCDIQFGGITIHIFNVHLGTAFLERRHQGRLLTSDVLRRGGACGPRIVVGDFNEWTKGLASTLMGNTFHSVDARLLARFGRTYPGIFPVLHLDHFYYDRCFRLERAKVDRTAKTLIASDHLPVLAEFTLTAATQPA